MTPLKVQSFALFLASSLAVQATIYVDPLGDSLVASGHYMDIASVAVTNDATALHFDIDLGNSAGFAGDSFAIFMVGFNTVPGGNSAASAWGNGATMPGMDFFGGGTASGINFHSAALGGWPEWQHGGSGSTWVGFSNVSISAEGIQFSVPLSTLGLSLGDTFSFDVTTAWSNPGHAIDAAGLNGTSTQASWSTLPYDSGANVLSYTVIPEPSVFASLLGLSAVALLFRRRQRRS